MDTDHLDTIVAQWRRERPDLDPSPMSIVGRIARIERWLDRSLNGVFGRFGLNRGEFDVLASLRRAGEPFRLTPTQLVDMLMLSSGAMTNRLDRLERAGWIERLPDPSDRRGTLVVLTPAGLALVDEVVVEHLANEHRILAALSADDQAQLATLLRTLLRSLEA